MICPACRAPMAELPVDGHYGASVVLDVCHACQALWFDERESLRLTPGATLELFGFMHDHLAERQRLPAVSKCPRCQSQLRDTHDRQRDTPFRYRRCPHGHGRFITWFDFLREKNFVRPLDPRQLAELRAHVRQVNCSNCGAPIDLQHASACDYCRTPISMLDLGQVERTLGELRDAENARQTVDPAWLLQAEAERRRVERLFDQLEQKPAWEAGGPDLVGSGLGAIVRLLRKVS